MGLRGEGRSRSKHPNRWTVSLKTAVTTGAYEGTVARGVSEFAENDGPNPKDWPKLALTYGAKREQLNFL